MLPTTNEQPVLNVPLQDSTQSSYMPSNPITTQSNTKSSILEVDNQKEEPDNTEVTSSNLQPENEDKKVITTENISNTKTNTNTTDTKKIIL
jgi:hypothetical protein